MVYRSLIYPRVCYICLIHICRGWKYHWPKNANPFCSIIIKFCRLVIILDDLWAEKLRSSELFNCYCPMIFFVQLLLLKHLIFKKKGSIYNYCQYCFSVNQQVDLLIFKQGKYKISYTQAHKHIRFFSISTGRPAQTPSVSKAKHRHASNTKSKVSNTPDSNINNFR